MSYLSNSDIKYFKMAVGSENIGKHSNVDIVARCPICGDSKQNKSKKRLHLYIKNGVTNVSCFNGDCPCHNKTVYSFLRDFYPELISGYKRETFDNTMNNLEEDVFGSIKPIKVKNQEQSKSPDVLTQDLSMFFSELNNESLEYISSRKYQYNEEDYGKWYYGHQDLKIGDTTYNITDSLIIPLYNNKEMYGFYSRNIHKKEFCTYMHDCNHGYKIWNWFNIDKTKEVYIFEGIFDAISSKLDNVIALLGAKLPDERLKELSHPVFVLDNDVTGIKNMISYAEKGYSVFVQPYNIKQKDMNEILLSGINTKEMITNNIFSGIAGVVRLKTKL